MEEKRYITFKVFRYNPETDVKPFYERHTIHLEKGVTVLRALNFIKDMIEPRLTYRHFCQAGICGSCAMKINGVSKLACTTQVWDELNSNGEPNTIVIEPLDSFEIIRDIVVENTPIVTKLEKYSCWTVPSIQSSDLGKQENRVSEEDFSIYEAATDCILCGCCYSECSITEANKEFISPLVMLRAFRHNSDDRDSYNLQRMSSLEADHGIWDCTHCYRCVEHCSKSIPIMDGIQALRHESFVRKTPSNEGKRHALAFSNDIQSLGRLNEATLPLRTKGVFGFIKMLPQMLLMVFNGRIPPMIPHKVPGIKQTKKMFQALSSKTD